MIIFTSSLKDGFHSNTYLSTIFNFLRSNLVEKTTFQPFISKIVCIQVIFIFIFNKHWELSFSFDFLANSKIYSFCLELHWITLHCCLNYVVIYYNVVKSFVCLLTSKVSAMTIFFRYYPTHFNFLKVMIRKWNNTCTFKLFVS